LFDDYCRRTGGNNALLIICDQLEAQDSSKHGIISLLRRSSAFSKIGEDDAKTGKMLGRMDPVLKCYPNCPQMITFNQDVLKGEANGSRTFLQQVVLKPHEQAANVFIQSSGATVKAVTASQVEYML
jgi:hypothetical protein